MWKKPEDLTDKQTAKLARIAHTDPTLQRAHLLTEGLRTVFKLPRTHARDASDRWISWARHCRIPPFVKPQKTIDRQRDRILAAIEHSLSNGRIDSVNTKIRLITRIAFGCRYTDSLTARAMLTLGGHRPTLPGRT